MRPLNRLRNFTRFGESIYRFLALHARGVSRTTAIFDLLTLEDPNLHADGAERGLGGRRRVVDVGAERVKRHASLVIAFDARDFSAAESATTLDLDALRAHPHRALHRALHGAAEGDTLRELARDVVGHELRIELGTLDLFDVDADFLAREVRELVTQLVDFRALLADHDARTTGVQRHDDLPRLALDHDVRDRRVPETRLEIFAKELVLAQQRRQITARVIARVPVLRDAESEADRMCLLSH